MGYIKNGDMYVFQCESRVMFGCLYTILKELVLVAYVVLSCTNHLVVIWSQICDTAVNGLIKSALVDPLLLKYTNNQRKELKRRFSGQEF